eukprot:COSAG06_NODE_38025_length_428_cov_0.808511_1_plen_20_part_10
MQYVILSAKGFSGACLAFAA